MSEKGELLLRKATVKVYVSLSMIYRWPGVLQNLVVRLRAKVLNKLGRDRLLPEDHTI